MTTTSPKKPALTTSQLYKQLEAEVLIEGARGEKGVKMKEAAEALAKEIGQKKLVFRVFYTMVCDKLDFTPKRSHFNNVCNKYWEVSKDEDGLIWVDLSKPKVPKNSR
ncbi:MAG TPA: hypothetical protein PL124_07170 [Candidatus Cloacimonadota bacterium]|jgi:hypothetical protein|nr:hypothetical protein [Candidatus Cloacimonadota bacterium]